MTKRTPQPGKGSSARAAAYAEAVRNSLPPSRVDPEEAAAHVRRLGLEPLEPYERRIDQGGRWHLWCSTCGNTVLPKYTDIRRGTSAGCMHCGEHRKPYAARLGGVMLRGAGEHLLDRARTVADGLATGADDPEIAEEARALAQELEQLLAEHRPPVPEPAQTLDQAREAYERARTGPYARFRYTANELLDALTAAEA